MILAMTLAIVKRKASAVDEQKLSGEGMMVSCLSSGHYRLKKIVMPPAWKVKEWYIQPGFLPVPRDEENACEIHPA
jgi:hypothetical protein